MAALLVRRLRGSVLQPTPVGLHFLPRLNHTDAQDSLERGLQEKKEELYDLLSKQKKLTYQNSRMMRHLSVQIKPRPGDPKCLARNPNKIACIDPSDRGGTLATTPSRKMDDSPASQIQQKKDELYDLLDKQKTLTFQNGRLMHNLSVQINPRPDDLRWHGFRIRKRLDYVVDAVTHSTIFILFFGAWLSWNEESSAEDGKEEALGVKNTRKSNGEDNV